METQPFDITINLIFTKLGKIKDILPSNKEHKFLFLFTKRNIILNTKEKKTSMKKAVQDNIIYYKNDIVKFSNSNIEDDNLEVSLCFISSDNTISSSKTKIFKIKELFKYSNGKEITLDLSNSCVLKVFISFSYSKEINVGSNTGDNDKNKDEGSKDKEKKFPPKSISVNMNLLKSYSINCPNVNNTNNNFKAVDNVVSNTNTNSTSQNCNPSSNCHVSNSFNISAKNINHANIDSTVSSIIKKFQSPVFSKKPPIQHRKNSAIAVIKNSPMQENKLTFEKKNSVDLNRIQSAEKATSFKKLVSPDRSLTRKLSGFENPKSNNNSILNLMLCKSVFSAEMIELGYEDFSEYEVGENFIEAIFIAGIPFKNAKVISESEKLPSLCTHKECSLIPSFKAEILGKFPGQGRSAIQLTSISASLCFTKGIKLCFTNDINQIPQIEDYMNMITNESGERFYQYNYHFFIKYDLKQFQVKFDIYNSFFANLNIEPETLLLIGELGLKDLVLIPYSLCLVSKFPLTQQIEKALLSILNVIFADSEESNESLNSSQSFKDLHSNKQSSTSVQHLETLPNKNLMLELIKHLTYEVPVPSKTELQSKKLKVYLPYIEKSIEIGGYIEEFDFPITAYSLTTLIEYINPEVLVVIFHLILHEQKMLFVSKSAKVLSMVLECIKAIIYPMKWVNTFIPVLSEDLIKFLQSFIPFIMGIEESLYFLAKEYLTTHEGIYIVNIDKGYIETSQKAKRINKKTLK